jgi:acetyl esterase/lipase/lysophospholipase L1-like esterase
MRNTFLCTLIFCYSTMWAQTEIPLYDGPIPNAKTPTTALDTTLQHNAWGNASIDILMGVVRPTLTIYQPPKDKATGVAVIICPGGGYQILATSHEGSDMAKRFNEAGITAFVLKYRLPKGGIMIDKTIGPLQDAQRAIQLVRERAAEWNVNPTKVGILGSSAGGHLASTAGTHWNSPKINNPRGTSLRPDFMILNYPVISFQDGITHGGSRYSLIGREELSKVDLSGPKGEKSAKELELPADLITLYSNELQVNAKTPPTFITAPIDDAVVPIANTNLFIAALQQNHVPVETFIYPTGEHGYGMINPKAQSQWMDACIPWIRRTIDPPAPDWANLKRFESDNMKTGMPKTGENRVVFMGNSITEGWKALVPSFFDGKPYVNRGISGQTTPQMVLRFRADVIDLKPKVVVILAGTNDIAGNTGPMTLEQTMGNIRTMVEMAKANQIRVVLCSVLPAYDFPWKPGLAPAEKIVKLNGMIKEYAATVGATYVDYFSAMADSRNGLRKELGDDGVHPNVAGYQIMAPLVEKGIADALRR